MALVVYEIPSRARHYSGLKNALPPKRQLECEAVNTLRRMMRDKKVNESCRIGAARTILEYATQDPVAEALSMLQGSDEAAIQFLEQKLRFLKSKAPASSEVSDAEFVESDPVRR